MNECMRYLGNYIIRIILLILVCSYPINVYSEFSKTIDKIVKNQDNSDIGIAITSLSNNKLIYAYQSEKKLKPASVLKLLTTAVALETLGSDYKFKTSFYSKGLSGSSIDSLYVKGGGDPNLRIEDLWKIVRKFKRKGIKKIDNIYLDDSYFLEQDNRTGQRAYQAGSSALSFNFNSIRFEICPTIVGRSAKVSVEPWEFPVKFSGSIKTVNNKASKFYIDEDKGSQSTHSYKVRGQINIRNTACSNIYRAINDPVSYFGHVFKNQLELLGIKVGSVTKALTPKAVENFYDYESKSLSLILEDLNHFSNNFTADQIVFSLDPSNDSKSNGRGISYLNNYLKKMGYQNSEFNIVDGSGLSHENFITPSIINDILVKFNKNKRLQPEFEKSLSVSGKSGTLKKRRFGSSLLVRGKTGSLNGVSTLAGYVINSKGKKISFAVLQNKVKSVSAAHAIEEKIVGALYRDTE